MIPDLPAGKTLSLVRTAGELGRFERSGGRSSDREIIKIGREITHA